MPRKKSVTIHLPGQLPKKMSVASIDEVIEKLNLHGSPIFVDGQPVNDNTTLKSGSVVRVGLPTKNA